MQTSELMHYKYVKRVPGRNGKWRYFYDLPKERPTTPSNRPLSRPKNITEGVGVQKRPMEETPENNTVNRPRSREKNITESSATVQKRDIYDVESAVKNYSSSSKDYNASLKSFGKIPLSKLEPLKERLRGLRN